MNPMKSLKKPHRTFPLSHNRHRSGVTPIISPYRLGVFALLLLLAVLTACSGAMEKSVLGTGVTATATQVTPTETEPAPVETTTAATEIQPTATPTATAIPTITATEPAPTVAPTSAVYHPEQPVWGIELHQIQPPDSDLALQAGAYWVRRNALEWSKVEHAEGQRNWDAVADLDAELTLASQSGMQVVLVVRNAPTWAQAQRGIQCGPLLPEKLGAFADFLQAAVERYSQPPFNVMYWELWNEPDVSAEGFDPSMPFGCWGEYGDAYFGGAAYAAMLKQAYPKIKAANPDVQVVIGGLLLDCDPRNPPEFPAGSGQRKDCSPACYLEGILVNGGGDYFDGVSFHAYDVYLGELGKYSNPNWYSSWDTTGPVLIAKSNYLRSLLDRFGLSDKFLMNTEVALICGRDGREAPCQTDVFEQTKAYYLAQAYAAAISEQLSANIWYSLRGWRASELIDVSGQPLPAFQAMSASASLLRDMDYNGLVDSGTGVTGYRFEKDGMRVWLVWSWDGTPHPLWLEQPPDAVLDVYGASLPVDKDQTKITIAPLYLIWLP